MRIHEARRLAEQIHADYVPQRYVGDNLEIVANLTSETNSPQVLAAVAAWHERKRNRRHEAIATALRRVSGTSPKPANDNQPRRRRAA